MHKDRFQYLHSGFAVYTEYSFSSLINGSNFSMNKNILFVIGGIILLGVGVYFYEQGNTAPTQKMAEKITDTTPTTKTPPADNVVIPATTTAATGTPANAKVVSTVAFTVEGSNYSFTPNALSVKRGQTVSLTFKNKEGFHDWRIDEFNIFASKVLTNFYGACRA